MWSKKSKHTHTHTYTPTPTAFLAFSRRSKLGANWEQREQTPTGIKKPRLLGRGLRLLLRYQITTSAPFVSIINMPVSIILVTRALAAA